ncbi:MAG: PAS domain S-box protein [Deltaproteobacteria bacterium]|nr:PAS domain S-box protein [Deltaproteobacteria bacterium]
MGKTGLDALADVDVAALWPAVEAAAERMGLGVYISRIEPAPSKLLYVSERASRVSGRPAAELVGASLLSSVREPDRPAVQERLAGFGDPRLPALGVAITRVDGTQIPVEVAATRIRTRHGVLSIGYVRDVSSEHRTIAALGESERLFQELVEAAPDGIVISRDGRIVFSNPRGAHLLGAASAEDVVGTMLASYLPAADAAAAGARIAEMMRTGHEIPPNEYRTLAEPWRVVEIKSIRISWEGKPAVLAFSRDVTERKALEQKLAHADRLNGLGTLAAGVAHEINNPLAYARLSLEKLARAGTSDPRALADIDHALARIAAITSSLRTFARPAAAEHKEAPPGPVDLGASLDHALRMVDHDLRHRARLVREVEPDLPAVRGHDGRLEQVWVNLLVNALQSLDGDDPCIEVAVTRPSQGRIAVAIRDNGRGIPAEYRDRIFEPFFTTKPAGEGLGLGLAVCKSIVEGCGGTIELASELGHGTTVTVTLRVHAQAPAGKMGGMRPAAGPGRLRVLIVDDEAPLRAILADLLGSDHDVATAASATEALELFDADAALTFDAVVCDLMMPGVDGRELYQRLAALRPGLERRIVFITGGILDREREQFVASARTPYLLKPFDVTDLLDAVARVSHQP